MRNKKEFENILRILDYSMIYYRQFFWKFTFLGILINVPTFLLDFFQHLMGHSDLIAQLIIFLTMILQLVLFFMFRPLLDAYIVAKVYGEYCETAGNNHFKNHFKPEHLLTKFPSLLFYRIIFGLLSIGCVFLFTQAAMPAALLIFGEEGLSRILPPGAIPMEMSLRTPEATLTIFVFILISLGLFLWVGYLMARWMFGEQAIFIENYKGAEAIVRSNFITQKRVAFMSLPVFMAFLLYIWILLNSYASVGLIYRPDIGKDLLGLISDPVLSVFSTIISSALFSLMTIVMTMTYVFVKNKKEAVSFEYRILRLAGKIDATGESALNFTLPTLMAGEKESEEVGIGTRLVSAFIDILIVGFVLSFGLLGLIYLASMLRVDALFLMVERIPEPLAQNPILFLISLFAFLFLLLFSGMELLMKGRTPGKRLLGLTIIRRDGGAPSTLQRVIRGIFRIFDVIPFLFGVGILSMLMDKKNRRLGDIMAGTNLVRESPNREVSRKNVSATFGNNLPPIRNEYPVEREEYFLLKDFLDLEELDIMRKSHLAYQLSEYFREKLQIPMDRYANVYDFFRDILSMNEKKYEG